MAKEKSDAGENIKSDWVEKRAPPNVSEVISEINKNKDSQFLWEELN